MANYTRNHLALKLNFQQTRVLIRELLRDNELKIDKLIPQPLNIYSAPYTDDDDEDFQLWRDWRRENWGTCWDTSDSDWIHDGHNLHLYFDILWTIPYPYIVAIMNTTTKLFGNVKATHEYMDGSSMFWGIERWSGNIRVSKRDTIDEDYENITRSLYG
jgi:hypothetical protein